MRVFGCVPLPHLFSKYPLIPTLWMIFEDFTFAFRSGEKHLSRRIMDNKKYDRLTKSLVYPLIEKYYRSGDLPSVFYKREGLSESQFYTWRQRYLRDHPAVAKKLGIEVKQGGNGSRRSSKNQGSTPSILAGKEGFVRVTVPAVAAPRPSASDASVYELCYPNGVRLRLPAGIAASDLGILIKLY